MASLNLAVLREGGAGESGRERERAGESGRERERAGESGRERERAGESGREREREEERGREREREGERAGFNKTRFNKIATHGAPQMAVDKEANSLSRVYSYYSKFNLRLFYV